MFAGTGAAALLVACGSDSGAAAVDTQATPATSGSTAATVATTATTSGADSTAVSTGAVTAIPEETAGPYPGDGSNGVNVLTESGIVRSDIRSSFGSSTTTADGVPLTIALQVSDAAGGTPLAGAAVYVWHCSMDGQYSMYSQGVTDENYLRGVQATDADGTVTFTSIYPGAYSGRWPHIHLEVYASLDDATGGGTLLATSQIALPEDTCKLVYATEGYSQSVQNLAQTSLATDNVFRDGWDQELGVVTGDVASGLIVTLAVPV